MSNRLYSVPINDHRAAPAFIYLYDPQALITGTNGAIVTGAQRPLTTIDFYSAITGGIGSIVVTGILDFSTTYTPTFLAITGSQIQIPTGVKSYSIFVESGGAYINGVLFNASHAFEGGGYNGQAYSTQIINIGCTGGRTVITYET